GVLVGNEPFRRRDEIIKDILLLELHPGLVPLLAILAAAANVGRSINEALFEQGEARRTERRRGGDVESAVGIEQRRIVAVEFEALLVNEEHRHARAVF